MVMFASVQCIPRSPSRRMIETWRGRRPAGVMMPTLAIALRFSFAPFGLLGVFIEHERDPFAQVMRHRRAGFVAQTFKSIQLLTI
jgi:hypothetical protein